MDPRRTSWAGLVSLLLAVAAGCGPPSAAGPPAAGDKPADKPSDKPADKPADNPGEKARGKPGEKSGEPAVVVVGRPVVAIITDYEDFIGHTEAVKSVEIRARVSGYLVKGLKDGGPNKEGTEVKEGDLLFEIDPRTYEADRTRAETLVGQSTARFERLDKDLKRVQELLPTRSISQGDYDQIVGDYKEAEAAVKTAQASLRRADLDLEFTKVRAPFDGQVSKQLIDPGNMVQADQTPLTTLVTLDPMYAYFDMDERTVLQLRRLVQAGQLKSAPEAKIKVRLRLADEDEYAHEGTIDFADNRLDTMTGTLRFRGVFPNPRRILSPGMFARIRVPIGEAHEALLIPEAAQGSDQGQRFVYVVSDKDQVEYRRIQVGALHGKLRVVKDGVKKGERIVVKGLQRIRPGSPVKPTEEDDQAAKPS